MSYSLPAIPDINKNTIIDALQAMKEIIEAREGLRGPSPSEDRFQSLGLLVDKTISCLKVQPQNGITGYFDDGSNFRITISKGIIIGIDDSSAAGYAITE